MTGKLCFLYLIYGDVVLINVKQLYRINWQRIKTSKINSMIKQICCKRVSIPCSHVADETFLHYSTEL